MLKVVKLNFVLPSDYAVPKAEIPIIDNRRVGTFPLGVVW